MDKRGIGLKEKVLILGSSGLIGHQVYEYLIKSSVYELYNISHQNKTQDDTILINARDESSFIANIIKIRPTIIVNCIGVLINESNINIENAIFLNSYLPHKIAKLADRINAKFIHLSTDCVFSGIKKEPYIETDQKDGIDNYAKTKGLGEVINDNHLTIRTSVVGPEIRQNGGELFHWFMAQSGSINGFTGAIWSGVTTIELAKAVKWAIENNITGLYHLTNNSSISKFELLKLFQKYTKKNILINPSNEVNLDKSFKDTRMLINYKIPSYEEMVNQMISLIKNKNKLYSQYRL